MILEEQTMANPLEHPDLVMVTAINQAAATMARHQVHQEHLDLTLIRATNLEAATMAHHQEHLDHQDRTLIKI